MASSFLLGYEGVLYYSATPLNGRPTDSPDPSNDFLDATWVEIDNVTDVDGQFESDSVDTTTRAEAKLGWASEIKTTKQGQLTFTMRWKPGDTAFDAMRAAWLAGSEIALMDLDGILPASLDSGYTDWADDEPYSVDEVVKHGSVTYRCTTAHTSATTTLEPGVSSNSATYWTEVTSQGIVANWTLSFGVKKPVKGIQTVDVSASISSYPNWVEIVPSTGVLVAI